VTQRILGISLALALTPAFAQELSVSSAPWLDPSRPELWAPQLQTKAVTILTPLATGSKVAAKSHYTNYYAPAMPAMGWTGSIASCTPGTISLAFKEWTISRANYFRAISGLPGNVALDTNATTEAQQQSAALLYSANQALSHSPTNPPFTACAGVISAAATAAGSSNISLAFGSSTYDDVVPRYMDDGGTGNELAGHRRWILYPPQVSFAVGSTPTGASWGGNALKVIGSFGSRPATPNGVAWPPAGFVPTQVLPASNRWSYSYNGASFAGATVSVTANGTPIASTVISNNAVGYGDNTIVFAITPAIVANTNYAVTVSGIAGAPWSSYTYTVRPFDATAVIPGAGGDFNANGSSDLLFANSDGRHAIWLMNGTTSASSAEIIGAGTGWSVVQIADFDGNGRSDLVWQHTDGRMAIYLMNGTTPSSTQQLLNASSGWTVKHTGDFNGDGRADLLFQHTDGSTAVWTMNGTTMTSGASIMGPGTGWSVVKVADFDGDGRDDLVWKHTDGRHAIWLMNGTSIVQMTQILNAGSWSVAQVADLNGDGKADIVWQHTDGSIAAWLMNGTAMTSGAGLMNAGSGWSVAKTGDFDGDGRADLLFQHTDGRAAIWLMNGLAPATQTQILNAGGGWTAKRIVDLNGDGKSDIAWGNTDGRVAVWLMNGTTMTSSSGILGAASGWSVSTVTQ
jgi:VCBS repeat protein